jgi:DNA-3-methyladenine glycosylase
VTRDPDLPLRPLVRAFFARPVLAVAHDLLGCLLIHETSEGRCVGRLVEVEAYGSDDPASHASRGRTGRNAPMFEEPGHAYVYFTYGMHFCLNVVTDTLGLAGAVLIRAAEPLEGADLMRRRRGGVTRDRDLARGPGRLTQAFAITRAQNRADVTRPPLWMGAGERLPEEAIVAGPRIGIGSTQDGRPWRFTVAGSPFVSSGPTGPVASRRRPPAPG